MWSQQKIQKQKNLAVKGIGAKSYLTVSVPWTSVETFHGKRVAACTPKEGKHRKVNGKKEFIEQMPAGRCSETNAP